MKTLKEYLLNKIVMGPNGCWVWDTRDGTDTYGTAEYNCRSWPAHHASYECFVGPIPEGKILRHPCDNRRCIRPDHLIPGTKKDNRRDFMERHPRAKELLIEGAQRAGQGSKQRWDRMSLEERQEWCTWRATKQRAMGPEHWGGRKKCVS